MNETINIMAEQSVIGGLLLSNASWDLVSGKIGISDFYAKENQIIFAAIAALLDSTGVADVFLVQAELVKQKSLPHDSGQILALLGGIARETPSAANIEHYADVMKNASRRRELQQLFSSVSNLVSECGDIEALIGDALTKTESIMSAGSTTYSTFREAELKTIDEMQLRLESSNEDGVIGVPTLPSIDANTGGMQAGQLIILAARPSIGKTALANQFALHAAKRGLRVGIMSLEMTAEDLVQRAWANTYSMSYSSLSSVRGDVIPDLTAHMANDRAEKHIYLDTETFSLGGIVSRISQWKRAHEIDLAIVDHIGLIEGGDNATRNDWMGKVSRQLKITAKRLSMPIIAVSQLNRSVEREKRKPVLADLRDSGNIEQDADAAIFLHVEPHHAVTNGVLPMRIGLLKNRRGMRGWLPGYYCFNGQTQSITEIPACEQEYFIADFEKKDSQKQKAPF